MNAQASNTQIQSIKEWLGNGSINIFGRPFAGKDTVCRKLAEVLAAEIIGGGDIMRNTPEFAATQAKVDDGSLAPSDEFLQMITPVFSREDLQGKSLVLSSVGRWDGEQQGVLAAAEKSGHTIKCVVYVDITVNELHKRWEASRQLADRGVRKDDDESALDKRISEFNNKTVPVLDFYKQKGLLVEVNGMNSREEVLQEILDKLVSRTSS